MNGFWIPRDKKPTAADFKRLASQSVGYDRDDVPGRVAAILYEIEKKKILLVKVADHAMREELWKAIVRHYEDMNEVQALHRDDQTADIDHAHKAIDDLLQTLAEGFKRDTEAVLKMRLTAQQATWLRFRITPCKRTTKQGATKYWSQQEIADTMNLTKMQVCRMESGLHQRPDIMDFLKTRHVPDRVKRSVTKGKKSG
jgi:hypothetical protein